MSLTTHITASGSLSEFWTDEQINLVKNTLCPGITDDELKLFFYACKNAGLDPFIKQIYPVKRGEGAYSKMTIQTGIDGYRLIAERSKKYVPGQEPEFKYTKDGRLFSATAYVKKLASDSTWHVVAATAFYDEYVQVKRDGNPNSMWAKMPRAMLAKCAEALALKKCFPAELSGIYSDEEMSQADNPVIIAHPTAAPIIDISQELPKERYPNKAQIDVLGLILKKCPEATLKTIQGRMAENNWESHDKIPLDKFTAMLDWARTQMIKEVE